MAGTRSPNYPNHSLTAALTLAKKLFEADGRTKMARLTVSKHLGHEVASGPALGKIGALRAYGLLVGSGEELQVSEDAIAALKAPEGSRERNEAILRLAKNPTLFQEIEKQKGTSPSKDNLVYWLIQQGFSESAASIAATSYLETQALVSSLGGEYNVPQPEPGTQKKPPVERQGIATTGFFQQEKNKLMENEREITKGMLSKTASFRLIVSGSIGAKEIERLIAKLELDKEILSEPEQTDGGETLGTFYCGNKVPVTGTYNMHHAGHAGRSVVEYTEGQRFTVCAECLPPNRVYYTLNEALPEADLDLSN